MRLLLDTHVFLWWLRNDPALSSAAISLIEDSSNQLFLSSASGFEISVKVGAGKLRLPANVENFITSGMRLGGIEELPIALRHTYHLERLPMIHRDPFDRLLIAAALEEKLVLVTSDAEIRKYPVQTTW